ncbi:MAG: hypothetical protein HY917_01540, partial [Candidatus Diapherotrites archaeon]|nr:hypothetical protein [Candidatus Diapherotrites archaeon]
MINLYTGNYKRHLLVPIVLFFVFSFLIFIHPTLLQGTDLRGGTTLIIRSETPLDGVKAESLLKEKFQLTELRVTPIQSPAGYGLLVEFSENQLLSSLDAQLKAAAGPAELNALLDQLQFAGTRTGDFQELKALAEKELQSAHQKFERELQSLLAQELGISDTSRFQLRQVGPSLGEAFWSTALTDSANAFLRICLVVFVSFREFVPSVAILAGGVFDVFTALAFMAFFRLPLSLTTIPALLMLLGYSVDTDILLTTRVLKRKDGSARARAHESMITGLTMTGAALGAVACMLVVSYYFQITVIFEVA